MAELERVRFTALDGDYEVRRWFGRAKFRCDETAADLHRIENGVAPFLKEHWREEQIGNCVNPEFVDNKLWLEADIGRGDLAQETLRDITDGIRKGISTGLYPKKVLLVEEDLEDHYNSLYEITEWEFLEASSVSIPAMGTIGIQMSEESEGELLLNDIKMDEKHLELLVLEIQRENLAPSVEAEDEEKGEEEMTMLAEPQVDLTQLRVQELGEIGREYGMENEALDAIIEGLSVEDFRKSAMKSMQERVKSVHVPKDAPFQRDLDTQLADRGPDYNFERMALSLYSDAYQSGAAIEIKKSDELLAANFSGSLANLMPAGGTPIPLDALVPEMFKRKLRAKGEIELAVGRSDGTTGEDLSPMWTLYAYDHSPILEKVRMLTGLINDELLPELGATTQADTNDTTDPTDANITKTNSKLTPKQNSASTQVSLLSQLQTRGLHGSYVRESLARGMMSKLQFDVEIGASAGASPTGARNAVANADVTAYTATNLEASTIHGILTDMWDSNAMPQDNVCAVVGTQLWYALRREANVTNGNEMLQFQGPMRAMLEDVEAFMSTHMVNDELEIGPWLEVYLGLWGTPVLTMDRIPGETNLTADLIFWRDVQSNRWDQFQVLHIA